jgi:hypothetical protein
MRRPEWNCVLDWSKSCRACSAPGPHQCPYGYLLDPEELAEVGRLTWRGPGDGRWQVGDYALDDPAGPVATTESSTGA